MSMTSTRADLYNLNVDIVKLQKALKRGTATSIPNVSTANATDLATAQALANSLKTTLNNLLTDMRTNGLIS